MARARTWTQAIGERDAVLLLAAHAVVWVAVLAWAPAEALADDVARFVQVSTAHGIPYRDFPVEYMPLETLLVRTLGASTGQVAVRVVAIAALSDVVVYLLISSLFGRRASVAYLRFALPLQVFMLYRLDLVSVVLVLCALAAARNGRAGLAGGVFGAAVMFKLWPLVLVPLLVRRGGRRSLLVFAAVVAISLGLWVAVGGADAIRYVISFRGATAWHVESTVGAAIGVLGDAVPRFELGAMRVGEIDTAAVWMLRFLGVAGLVAVWWKARTSRWDLAGAPSAAAVAVLIATAPVASAQYVAWLLPWCAVAVVERSRRVLTVACGAACFLAAASFLVYWDVWGGIRALEAISFARALCVVTIAIAWLTERGSAVDG